VESELGAGTNLLVDTAVAQKKEGSTQAPDRQVDIKEMDATIHHPHPFHRKAGEESPLCRVRTVGARKYIFIFYFSQE